MMECKRPRESWKQESIELMYVQFNTFRGFDHKCLGSLWLSQGLWFSKSYRACGCCLGHCGCLRVCGFMFYELARLVDGTDPSDCSVLLNYDLIVTHTHCINWSVVFSAIFEKTSVLMSRFSRIPTSMDFAVYVHLTAKWNAECNRELYRPSRTTHCCQKQCSA